MSGDKDMKMSGEKEMSGDMEMSGEMKEFDDEEEVVDYGFDMKKGKDGKKKSFWDNTGAWNVASCIAKCTTESIPGLFAESMCESMPMPKNNKDMNGKPEGEKDMDEGKPEGEKDQAEKEGPSPPGHHLDKQYCNSNAEFFAGKCRGCEKLCHGANAGTRYAEEEDVEVVEDNEPKDDMSGKNDMEDKDDMGDMSGKDDMDDKVDMEDGYGEGYDYKPEGENQKKGNACDACAGECVMKFQKMKKSMEDDMSGMEKDVMSGIEKD